MAWPAPADRAPVWLALALGALTSLARVPFRSRYLFAWDSANFALALDQYNVAFHQPQPPGYPMYVAAAGLARRLTGEANAAYVTLSVIASGLAVTFLVLAAHRLYGRRVALLAAVLLATNTLSWGQGVVAYPYSFLACFTALVAWLCLCIGQGAPRALALLTGAVIGLAAGFRSELAPFLAPLWLYACLRAPGTRRHRLLAVAPGGVAMALSIAAWYVPMVQLSGGWAAYQAATGGYYAYFIQTTSGAGKLLLGLLENTRALVGFLYNGVGLALLPMVYFVGRFFAPQRLVRDWRARFVAVWLAPPLAFYVTVHIGNPGYVLSLLPALCIFAAQAVLGMLEDVREAAGALTTIPSHLGRGDLGSDASWRRADQRIVTITWVVPAAWLVVLAIGLSNTALFLLANGEGRRQEIRQIDRIFERQLAEIEARFPPESTLIVSYDRSRQYRYYLPRHKIHLLFDVAVAGAVTDTSRYWERRATYRVPPGITAVLFPDLGRNTSDQPGIVERVDLGVGVDLYVARVRAGDEVRYGYQYATGTRA
ncbi:MAG: hypothetical protein AVDCRST_MAG77-5805 [uncultured Chloroflexi bacterium]|uniref:Glycosyltransferase RgtA/B/C/D-like domain-containing protein n=1 Tax=uncultured Chloroflexota bacterium TaxID=166587 RepID=A0A6J4KDB0_9CHLR|nr:MAG: hypothetical protein AVDCRST_MAG77-5805 [uncultured Chloroflexota bacterium]